MTWILLFAVIIGGHPQVRLADEIMRRHIYQDRAACMTDGAQLLGGLRRAERIMKTGKNHGFYLCMNHGETVAQLQADPAKVRF